MDTINFGIDLGTTNSAIAKYNNSKVVIYKNPVGFKDSLPSVISYRRGRVQIGDKAREQVLINPLSVFSSFKRKMGTDETYFVKDTDNNVSPIDLSSKILAELKSFVLEENVNSCVITIPASFDTIQSNATKKAGYKAGIEEVVLLQEPIAACLAYSNNIEETVESQKNWLVYDFGGGTFDVALVNIDHRELKIVDHKGNNFLGGLDIDNLIVEKIFCPKIEAVISETGLWNNLTTGSSLFYKKLYAELLFKAEELKKELSIKGVSSIEVDFEEKDVYVDIEVTLQEFNAVIVEVFEETYQLVTNLLAENAIGFHEIERIILVGGTTYIPYIRSELEKRSKIAVDSSVDPTTAVVVGAAYYAGNKTSVLTKKTETTPTNERTNKLKIDWVFESSTQDEEELITAVFDKPFTGYYRIIRKDGGFDSGKNTFENKISEFVPLLTKTNNSFIITIYNQKEEQVYLKQGLQITNGLYNVSGQPLPNDICLELDDEDGNSFLEQIFKKNQILPLKKTLYKTSSKTILKNSDDKLIINVVEGHGGNMPASNLAIGYLELEGKNFSMDLLQGMDIELEFEMSESRDLSISVYISSLDLDIKELFTPHERAVSVEKLCAELKYAIDQVNEEVRDAEFEENYEYLINLKLIIDDLNQLRIEGNELLNDNTTSRKYQLNDKKRATIQKFDDLTKHKLIIAELKEYKEAKELLDSYMSDASEKQKKAYSKLFHKEKEVLESQNKYLIRKRIKSIESLTDSIYIDQDYSYYNFFLFLKIKEPNEYKSERKSGELIKLGDGAMENNRMQELKAICNQLYSLLIEKPSNPDEFKEGNLGLR